MAGCFLICRVFFFDQTLYFFGIGEKNRPTEKLVQLEGVVEQTGTYRKREQKNQTSSELDKNGDSKELI